MPLVVVRLARHRPPVGQLQITLRAPAPGPTVHEIAATTGHLSLSIVQLYTQSADQERLARAAIVRLPTHAKARS